MKKYYAKQIDPEYQTDNLFYNFKDKAGNYQTTMLDDFYNNNVVIDGNRDFISLTTNEYDDIKNNIYDVALEYDAIKNKHGGYYGAWDNFTQLINYYFKGVKKYTTKDIHLWRLLLEEYMQNYNLTKDIVIKALKLMTGITWRAFWLRGIMQSEYQSGYASEYLTDKDLEYIEACYFNTGTEYIVFENKKDFNKNYNGVSYYICSYDVKDALSALIGCDPKDLIIYDFDGYTKTPKYKEGY